MQICIGSIIFNAVLVLSNFVFPHRRNECGAAFIRSKTAFTCQLFRLTRSTRAFSMVHLANSTQKAVPRKQGDV
jgi:hypothetical protein